MKVIEITSVGYYIIELETLFYIIGMLLFGHFLADWVLQTRKMAENKSNSWFWLSMHVLMYTVAFTGCSLITFHNTQTLTPLNGLWFGLINGAIHFIVDAITSRFTSYFYTTNRKKAFWTTIGFDQLIHMLTIIITLYYFLINK